MECFFNRMIAIVAQEKREREEKELFVYFHLKLDELTNRFRVQ